MKTFWQGQRLRRHHIPFWRRTNPFTHIQRRLIHFKRLSAHQNNLVFRPTLMAKHLGVSVRYVAIYKAMVANQQSYERGLEDLKLSIDVGLDRIKHSSSKRPVGELLQEIDVRNINGDVDNVQGINIAKQFMPSVADTNGVNLNNYKVVKKGQFAYSGMQTGRDECIRIALYTGEQPILISPAYSVFVTKDESVLAEYIMVWFSRAQSDRRGWFMSDSSIRTNLDLERFYEIKIPVPEMKMQSAIVELYSAYTARRNISEQLKAQIKDICPILIKGSLEEGENRTDRRKKSCHH
jgi:type I restriction enzyme S subunit